MPGNVTGGLNADVHVVLQMLDDNPIEDEPSVGTIVRSLPGNFDRNNTNHRHMIRHLYRNFYGVERNLLENKTGANVPLSPRERDIIVYCIVEKMDVEFCHKLLPYRESDSIDKLYKAVEEKEYHSNQEHVDHVRRTVGMIYDLEIGEGESTLK